MSFLDFVLSASNLSFFWLQLAYLLLKLFIQVFVLTFSVQHVNANTSDLVLNILELDLFLKDRVKDIFGLFDQICGRFLNRSLLTRETQNILDQFFGLGVEFHDIVFYDCFLVFDIASFCVHASTFFLSRVFWLLQ